MVVRIDRAGGVGFQGAPSSTDNALVRWDGTTGKFVQDGAGSVLSDNGALTLAGATVTASEPVLNLSQTWNNAGVTFTGLKLNVTATASAAASLLADFQLAGVSKVRIGKDASITSQFGATANDVVTTSATGTLSGATNAGGIKWQLVSNAGAGAAVLRLASDQYIAFNSTTSLGGGALDTFIQRVAAGVVQLMGATVGAGLQFTEMTAPTAPATNNVILFSEDSGGGKTRLVARFPTGSDVVLATEA